MYKQKLYCITKEVLTTSPRTGRPTQHEEKKTERVGFRLTPTAAQKLEYCSKVMEKSRNEVVEQGIDMVYETLEPQQKEKDQ